MANYIRYANQGAGRNLPLSDDLIQKLKFLEDIGVTAEVFSGGVEPGRGKLSRSGRHVHGGAGDMRFYRGDERLNWANEEHLPVFEEIVRRAKGAGITGIGAGPGYMEEGTMHIGGGNAGVWGAGGKGANAPAWLRKAYGLPVAEGGSNIMAAVKSGQIDPVAEVIAAKQDGNTSSMLNKAAETTAKKIPNMKPGASEELSIGDKLANKIFGEETAAKLKKSFGPDAKANPMAAGLGLFAGGLGMGTGANKSQEMNIDPSSLGSVEAADAQRAAGAQQLMAALLANRRRV